MTAREDIRVLRSKDELKIIYRWFWPGSIAVFTIHFLWTVITIIILKMLSSQYVGRGQEREFFISLLLLLAFGSVAAYWALGKVVNSTEVHINRSTITIQAKPLPWANKRIIPSGWVWDVFRTEYPPYLENERVCAINGTSPKSLYRLNLLLTNGSKVCLLSGIRQRKNACQMVASIDSFLQETRREDQDDQPVMVSEPRELFQQISWG